MRPPTLLGAGLTLAAALVASVSWGCEKPGPNRSDPPGDGALAPAVDDRRPPSRTDGSKATPDEGRDRRRAIAADDPLLERLEGATRAGECADDQACFAAGCSGEVCSADPEAASDCDLVATRLPAAARCGCVDGECMWYQAVGSPLSDQEVPTEPPPGVPETPAERGLVQCGTRMCPPGTECIEYFGIAGSHGGTLRSCETRCDPSAGARSCPPGKTCVVVADGPGPVCR